MGASGNDTSVYSNEEMGALPGRVDSGYLLLPFSTFGSAEKVRPKEEDAGAVGTQEISV